MTESINLVPGRSDRAAFIGCTGSGKTELAIRLLASRRYVVIHDGKGEFEDPNKQWYSRLVSLGFSFFNEFSTLVKQTNSKGLKRVCYCPNLRESRDDDIQNKFFYWIYQRENTTCYVDEIGSVTTSNYINDGLHACLTRGRSRNVELWIGTQRPKKIPEVVISESQNFYLFELLMPQDVQRMYEVTGLDTDSIKDLEQHEFFYIKRKEYIGPLKLNLAGANAEKERTA